jgi:4-diphosphocytidyl-2-C-methyl-D-erythritol kinase
MGVKIHIKKRIPVAAGLGGGSSDAAGVLIGIDRLFKLNISKDRLMRLGAKLGADVPFFIFDAPFAIGRGIGDKLEKVDLNTKFYNMIIYPGFKVATNEIYQALDVKGFVSQHGLGPNTRLFLRCLTNKWGDVKISPLKNLDSLEDILYNDLEKVVVSKRPKIGKVIKCLASSLDKRIMVSGSGPSVFCLCSTRREAMQAKERLYSSIPKSLRRRWQIFVVETMV